MIEGVFPTACFTIQLPLKMDGMSLKRSCRNSSSPSRKSPNLREGRKAWRVEGKQSQYASQHLADMAWVGRLYSQLRKR
jgi:hypothetical protein